MAKNASKLVEIIFNAIDNTSRVFNGIRKSLNRAEQSVDRLNVNLKEMGTSLQEVGVAMATVGAAMAVPFVGAIKKAGDFEKAMSTVKAISGATEREFKKLTKTALHLGRTTSYTAAQSAEGFKFLAMAGLDASEAIGALPSVLQLAKAGSLELGTAADITTNILTSYRFGVEDLVHVNDVLVKAFTNSNTNLIELGEGFKFVGPLARGLGAQFEDVIATMGKLGDAGIKASVAGTTLRGTISALFNPTSEEEKLLGNLSNRIGEVGFQIRNSEGDFVGFGDLIRQLEVAGIEADEALKLFGLRAGPGIAALLGVGSKAIVDFTDELVKSDGVAAKISKTMGMNFLGAVTRLSSAFDGLAISIGTPFLNSLAGVADGMAAVLLVATELHEAFGPLSTAVDIVVLSLGSLFVAVTAIGGVLKFVIAPLIKFVKVLGLGGLVGAATKARVAVSALGTSLGPIGLAFLASIGTYNVLRLITVLYRLQKEAKKGAEAETQLEETIERSNEQLQKLAKTLDISIKDMAAFNKLVQDGQLIFDKASKTWVLAADSVKNIFKEAAAAAKKAMKDVLAVMDRFEHASSIISLRSQATMLEVRRQFAVGTITSEAATIALKEKIQVAEAKRRLDLVNTTFAAVKLVFSKETDEYKGALRERLAAENNYNEAKLLMLERVRVEQKELAEVEQVSSLNALLVQSREDLFYLDELFKKGSITIRDYFTQRKEIITTQYNEEKAALLKLIEAEEDEAVVLQLKQKLLEKNSDFRKQLVTSINDENTALENLEDTKARLREVPETVELRLDSDSTGNSFQERQSQEEMLLIDRHEKELQRLQDMTVVKDLEAQKQLEIKRTQTAQEAELVTLLSNQEKDAAIRNTEQIASSFGDISTLFGDLYEASGKNTKEFFELQKAAAISQATINTYLAVTKALAENSGLKGYALAAVALAKGMAHVAKISSQSMADGGVVQGHSPHSKADNIPINATANEFMQPVSAVKHYGLDVMEAIRHKVVPKELFSGFRLPSFQTPVSKMNFSDGGSVVPNTSSYSVSVPVNVSGFSDGLSGRLQQGIEDVVINIMREELA